MTLNRSIIDQSLATGLGEAGYKVVETLADAGYDTWWVGGSIREMLRGNIPDDIDIATSATPEQIIPLFKHVKEVPRQLGSTRVREGTHVFEVTTFRKESQASDGRIPESIEFSNREEDAKRRDFTINALYFNPISGELYDPFNGEADLHEKLIRFIGDPVERIKHDALRSLRAVRFRARIDGQYHPDTYKALRDTAALIKNLSAARKLEELEKLLLTPNADRGLEDLWELGILQHMIPELYECKGVAQPKDYHHEGDVWNHTLQCVRSFNEDQYVDVRLAALFHDVGKIRTFSISDRIHFDEHAKASAEIAGEVLGKLGISNKRKEKIMWLIEHHMMMGTFKDLNDERKAHWYFHQCFPELLQLFWLDVAGTTPSDFSLYESIVKDYNAYLDKHPRPVSPLLNGKEIMELTGLKPSARIGELMDELHDAQTRKEITTKQEARDYIVKMASQ